MAVISFWAKAAKDVRSLDTGVYNINQRPALSNAPGAFPQNADNIVVFTMPHDARFIHGSIKPSATLGAGATVKLQRNRGGARIDLTVASTATTTTVANSGTIGPVDLLAGDIIELLVGGANISAAATVEVDIQAQHS